ncbi:hypothetical protein NQ317_005767 [Molorchus minor]|uniref:Uncharacterized protein n=1 Tax=Molorchus minor TaxID=1323400 RepID=A0ABQ9JDG3_9CUCU|nr:hypothetical protein NQ317_005767 [Molorchus minor]
MFKEYEETRAIWFAENTFEDNDVYFLIDFQPKMERVILGVCTIGVGSIYLHLYISLNFPVTFKAFIWALEISSAYYHKRSILKILILPF